MRPFLFLIPLLPLVGFLFNFTIGVRVLGRKAAHGPSPIIGLVAAGTVFLSFLVAVYAVVQAQQAPDHAIVETLFTWLPGGAAETAAHATPGATAFTVEWAYMVDPLSSVMVVFVTLVGFLIHVYSIGYMGHDPGYARYMAYLNLFMFAMLTLVLGANYAVLFVGWEGVGLCSYLLIGFWFHKQSASDAGKKAFIVNRIGDAGFLAGMFLVFVTFGTLDFQKVMAAVAHLPVEWAWGGTLTLIGLLLFIGAIGKSAQMPLFVWLPDAMEGPTPVSAMIHAATMVSAGVYAVIRMFPLTSLDPQTMTIVAFIGAFTAIFAATIAVAQNDIKRVLAYSTISQLGFMIAALGTGAYVAAVFHLMTHAFFKALLFLGSGSVIHGMEHGVLHTGSHQVDPQDMYNMGGLRKKMPVTFWTFLIGGFALSGFPLVTAGFWLKDEILADAFGHGHWAVVLTLALAALLIAFYTMRQITLTFLGEPRTPEAEHARETPWTMTLPLVILSVFAVTYGWVGIPEHFPVLGGLVPNWLHEFVGGTLAEHPEAVEFNWTPLLTSLVVALGGLYAGWLVYRNVNSPAEDRFQIPLLKNKYYFDEFYDRTFVKPAYWFAENVVYKFLDQGVIDGFL